MSLTDEFVTNMPRWEMPLSGHRLEYLADVGGVAFRFCLQFDVVALQILV